MEKALLLAISAAFSGLLDTPKQADMCLAYVRVIVENAYGMKPYEFYSYFGVSQSRRVVNNWTAADIERSMRELGYAVPWEKRRAGDLVFNHRATAMGHVGILLSRDLVAESIPSTNRPNSLMVDSFQAITPVSSLDITMVARLPDPEYL